MSIKRHAIRHIAGEIQKLRLEQRGLEEKHMRFDCSFDDAQAERRYSELGKVANELELICCTTFESAEYLQRCLCELREKAA